MVGFIVLSGSKGFTLPNIALRAFIYCLLKPQFPKIFRNENPKYSQ
jgi:hypothetical protein